MRSDKLSRRDFIKLLQLVPFVIVQSSNIGSQQSASNDDNLPNILIVLFDALSAKNMSLYGYLRKTTPKLDHIAQQAMVFNRHYAGGNFTPPGTASLLTGTYPWSHRALNIYATAGEEFQQKNLFWLYQEKYRTFAYSHNTYTNVLLNQFRNGIEQFIKREKLCLYSHHLSDMIPDKEFAIYSQAEAAIFWRQVAQIGPPSSFLLSRLTRTKRALVEPSLNSKYAKLFPRGVPTSLLTYFTVEDTVDWIKKQVTQPNTPFFGYVHLLPPHHPYNTRHEFIDIFADEWKPVRKPMSVFSEGHPEATIDQMRQHYDEYIAYVDAEFHRLYDFLDKSGILDNTVLIFTSDHGEMFERGIWMHNTPTLYEPIVQVPLLIWNPGQRQRVDIHTPTSCVDILPTLLHLSKHTIPEWCEGEILPPYLDQSGNTDRSIFVVEAKENSKYLPLERATIAHIKGKYKLIYYRGYKSNEDFYELFNMEKDPHELDNIFSSQPAVANELREILLSKLSQVNEHT
jgi:arylsulfatase A-like enzyme